MGAIHGGLKLVPGLAHCRGSERVTALILEGVPVSHGKAQMLFHGFAHDHLLPVVPFKCQRVLRFPAFILNFSRYSGKK